MSILPALCEGNPPITSVSPNQGTVMWKVSHYFNRNYKEIHSWGTSHFPDGLFHWCICISGLKGIHSYFINGYITLSLFHWPTCWNIHLCRTANMSWRTCVVVKQIQSNPIHAARALRQRSVQQTTVVSKAHQSNAIMMVVNGLAPKGTSTSVNAIVNLLQFLYIQVHPNHVTQRTYCITAINSLRPSDACMRE